MIHTKLDNFLKQQFFKLLSQKEHSKRKMTKISFIKRAKDYFIPFSIDIYVIKIIKIKSFFL